MTSLFLIPVAFLAVLAPGLGLPNCPVKSPVHNFNQTKYMGSWYELKRYPNMFEVGIGCVIDELVVQSDGSMFLESRMYNMTARQHTAMIGNATLDSSENSLGKLHVIFPNNFQVDYLILGTDYDNFAVLYACLDLGGSGETRQIIEFAWVIGRQKALSEEVTKLVEAVEKSNNIQTELYEETDHSDCPLPDPV